VSGLSYLRNACGANLYTQLPPADDPTAVRPPISSLAAVAVDAVDAQNIYIAVYIYFRSLLEQREKSSRGWLDPKDYN